MTGPTPDLDLDLEDQVSDRVADPVTSARIVGAWQCNAERLFCVTGTSARLFGLEPEFAAAGAPLTAYLPAIHPEDREWLWARVRMQVEGGGVAVAEFRTIGSGAVRWLLSRGHYYLDEAGLLLGGSGILIDTTEAHDGGQHNMYAAPGAAAEDPLMRLSSHALGLRYAIDAIGDEPSLRVDVDKLLRTIGFAIARRIRDNDRQLN